MSRPGTVAKGTDTRSAQLIAVLNPLLLMYSVRLARERIDKRSLLIRLVRAVDQSTGAHECGVYERGRLHGNGTQ